MALPATIEPRVFVVAPYTETTTVTVQTTAAIEVPLTLRIPAPTSVASSRYATDTIPAAKGPTAAPAHVTSVPVTVLTEAVFRVTDQADGVFQLYTLKQLAPGENVSSVVTLHGLSTLAPVVFTGAPGMPPALLPTPLGAGLTPLTTATLAASSSSMVLSAATAFSTTSFSGSPVMTPSAAATSVNSTHHNPHDMPDGSWIGAAVVCGLLVFSLFALAIYDTLRYNRDKKKGIKTRRYHMWTPEEFRTQHREQAQQPPPVYDDPEAAEFAARVQAGMDMMQEMQQKNRENKGNLVFDHGYML